MRVLLTTAALLAALMLGGCLTYKTATDHYDECATQSSFVAMVECGKQKRGAYCQQQGNCSPKGNAFLQYADALAQSVKNKEMSEADAKRRFAEFKMKVLADDDRDAAIAAGSGPKHCLVHGSVISCN